MQARSFDVSIRHEPGRSVVACSGELDIATSARLEEAFGLCLERTPGALHIDCSGVSFIDSSGIRLLVEIARRCAERGTVLVLHPSVAVRKVADILGIGSVIGIQPNGHAEPGFPGAAAN